MKLGMPILYEYDSIEENLKLAKELNLDFVELNLNFSYCRNEMEEKTVEKLLNKYNLEATLHFYDEADFAGEDLVVDAYLKLLDKYATLGKGYIKNINVHNQRGPVVTISGVKNYIYDKEFDIYIKRLINNFNKAKEICSKNDINLVIENTDDIPSYIVNTYKELYKNNFVFCYDIGHDYIDNQYLFNLYKDTKLTFKEFHIHDASKNKCHLSLGDGELDIKWYKDLAILNDAYVVLEVKQKEDLYKSVPIFKTL